MDGCNVQDLSARGPVRKDDPRPSFGSLDLSDAGSRDLEAHCNCRVREPGVEKPKDLSHVVSVQLAISRVLFGVQPVGLRLEMVVSVASAVSAQMMNVPVVGNHHPANLFDRFTMRELPSTNSISL